MSFSFECYAITNIGNRRKNNEDNFYITKYLTPDEQASMSQSKNNEVCKKIVFDGSSNMIFAVSDGMGGHKDGEVASFMVVDAIDVFVRTYNLKPSRKRKDKFAYIQSFQEMIASTNQRINDCENGLDIYDSMGATLSGFIVFLDEIVIFNIGDSSTFLFENNKLHKVTKDDNNIMLYKHVDSNQTSTKIHRKEKRLTKFFGLPKSNGILTATLSAPIAIKSGQLYIIASDGLTDSLSYDMISRIIEENNSKNIENIVKELIESSLDAECGGYDNITIVMVRVK